MDVKDHPAVEIDSQLLLEVRPGSGLRFLDGKVFLVEVPDLVTHAELDSDELFGISVQESADSAGEVRVEHGVAVTGRREQHLGRIENADLKKADLAPEFVTVHIEIFAGKPHLFDFARRNMEIVGDVMDGEEERDLAEILIGRVCECAGEGSAPFVAKDGSTFEMGVFCIGQGRRGQEGEPDVVVCVGGTLGRSVNVGPTEILFVVDIGVQRVLVGNPDLVGLVLEPFGAGIDAVVALDIDHHVLEKRRACNNFRAGARKSVGHAVDRGGQRTGLVPVSCFGAYDKNIHA